MVIYIQYGQTFLNRFTRLNGHLHVLRESGLVVLWSCKAPDRCSDHPLKRPSNSLVITASPSDGLVVRSWLKLSYSLIYVSHCGLISFTNCQIALPRLVAGSPLGGTKIIR
jgi:hypothetical protein